MAIKDFAGLARGNAGNGLASGGLGGQMQGDKRGSKPAVVKSTERRNKETPTKYKDTGLS
jgi:hypothetical protein